DRATHRGSACGQTPARFLGCRRYSRRPGRAGRATRGLRRGHSVEEEMTSDRLPGPKARALIERDAAVVSPSYTRGYPLVIKRASGASVEDVDGNLFLDCAAGIAVNATGHCHPDVVKAIVDQAQRFLHQARALRDRPSVSDRALRGVSWPDDGVACADGEQARAASRIWSITS